LVEVYVYGRGRGKGKERAGEGGRKGRLKGRVWEGRERQRSPGPLSNFFYNSTTAT